MIPIFIGYDPREAIAYHVCTNSIIRHSSHPVSINPLALNILKDYEEKHTDGSNHFIYSRFLVPHLMEYKGWAIFMDGDMLLRDDIEKLWALRDESKAVMVVKHNYKTKMTEKYLGSKNEDYPCKNWSSVILWNCGHPANAVVTPEFIQNATGAQVHRFTWLPDELVCRRSARVRSAGTRRRRSRRPAGRASRSGRRRCRSSAGTCTGARGRR